MAAKDSINPNQLQMFMPAKQLRGLAVNPGEALGSPGRTETPGQVWERKLWESKRPNDMGGASLHEEVAQSGVKRPVHISHRSGQPTIGNGYHRIAAQAEIDPSAEVPVMNHDKVVHAVWAGNKDENMTNHRGEQNYNHAAQVSAPLTGGSAELMKRVMR